MEEPGPTIRRILLVDDERVFLEVQSEILRRLGYAVVASYNPMHALQLFRGSPREFDLIIADEIMPRMTGSEMCRRMREIRPDIPIIIITAGMDLLRTQEKAALYGVRQVLLKPVLRSELCRAIERAAFPSDHVVVSSNR